MKNSLNKLLMSVLDATGDRWKTSTGAALLVGMPLAVSAGVLDQGTVDSYYRYAEGLFAAGLLHARLKSAK